MAENLDKDGIPTDRALDDEEHQKLDKIQITRCVGIAKSMLQIFAKHVDAIDLNANDDKDAKKFMASIEPIVEDILKMQRGNGMILKDLPVVDFLFKTSFDTIEKALAKHYKEGLSQFMEEKIGKPQYEVSAQDLRDAWDARVEKAKLEKIADKHVGAKLAPITE